MSPAEIQTHPVEDVAPEWQSFVYCAKWLREIALQLAILNEQYLKTRIDHAYRGDPR